jgi:Coenzyme PQQ synthesis protein D (PqqD)
MPERRREMAEPQQIPMREDGVHFEEMAGESLLFNEANKKTIYLNESASAIWQLCDGRRSIAELVDLIREAYSDPEHDFAGDVSAALDSLFAEGVLKWREAGR